MKRAEILKKALECVNGDRDITHGKPEDNLSVISFFWNIYIRSIFPDVRPILTEKDVAIMMILLKIARETTGHSIDNYVDIAGYAACAGEIDERNTKNEGI